MYSIAFREVITLCTGKSSTRISALTQRSQNCFMLSIGFKKIKIHIWQVLSL